MAKNETGCCENCRINRIYLRDRKKCIMCANGETNSFEPYIEKGERVKIRDQFGTKVTGIVQDVNARGLEILTPNKCGIKVGWEQVISLEKLWSKHIEQTSRNTKN